MAFNLFNTNKKEEEEKKYAATNFLDKVFGTNRSQQSGGNVIDWATNTTRRPQQNNNLIDRLLGYNPDNSAVRKPISYSQNQENYLQKLYDKYHNPISEEGKGSFWSGNSDEYNQFMGLKGAQKYNKDRWDVIQKGIFNESGDYGMMNRVGRSKERFKLNSRLEELQKEQDKYQADIDKYERGWQPELLDVIKVAGTDEQKKAIKNEEDILSWYSPDSEEYKNAQRTLDGIVGSVRDNMRGTFGTGGNAMMQLFDAIGYNEIDAKGMYNIMRGGRGHDYFEDDTYGMDEGKKNAMLYEIDKVLNPARYARDQMSAGKNRMDYVKNQMEQLDYYDRMEDEYWEQMNREVPDYEWSSDYDTDRLTMHLPGNVSEYTIKDIVSFVNEGNEYNLWTHGNPDTSFVTKEYRKAALMLPEESEKLTDLYLDDITNGRKPEQAEAFMEALEPYLNERYRIFEKAKNEAAARQHPIMATAIDVLSAPAAPFNAALTGIGILTGDKEVLDPNSDYHSLTRQNQDIEAQITKDLGDTGGLIYQAGVSGLKNFMRGIMTGGMPAQQAAVMMTFFGEAFDNSYLQNLDKYKNEKKAGWYALTDAAVESLFEVASVESMLGDPTNFMQYMLKNVVSEASEEFFGSTIGPHIKEQVSKLLDDGELGNEWKERAAQILENGGYYDENGEFVEIANNDVKGAWKQVVREWDNETMNAMLSAALSSGGAALYGGAQNYANKAEIGRRIANSGIGENMEKGQAAGTQAKNRYTLLDLASKMREGTHSRQLYEVLHKKIFNENKSPSNAEIGELGVALINDTDEEMGQIAESVLQQNILDELKGKGVQNPATMAEIVAKLVQGKKLSKEEMTLYAGSKAAQEVNLSFRSGLMPYEKAQGITKSIQEKTEDLQEIRDTVTTMLTTDQDRKIAEQRYNDVVKDAAEASEKEIREAEGEVTGEGLEVVTDGKIKKVTGIRTRMDPQEGRRVMLLMEDGSEADITMVKGVNKGAAQALKFAEEDQGRTAGDNMTQAIVTMAQQVKNVPALLNDAMKITWDVLTGKKTIRGVNLTAEQTSALREAAEADFEAAENERVKNQRQLKPGEGQVTYNGAVYGSKEFTDAIRKLKKTQRNEAFAIGAIAKAAGFDVEIYENANDVKNQGSYGASGGVRINLAGEYKDGVHRGAVATLAHEFTHQLEGNSREAYAKLRTFVLNNLQRQGINLQQQAHRIIDTYKAEGVDLDVNGAIAEIVAKGCEEVLTNEETVKALRAQDPNTFGKMRKIVNSLVERIQTALGAAKGTSSIYAQYLRQYSDTMSKLWLNAYEEAKGATGTAEGGTVQASVQESGEHRKPTIDIQDALRYPHKYDDYFTYESLTSKDPIKLTQLNKIDTSKTREQVVNDAMENAIQNGRKEDGFAFVPVYDIGTEVRVGERGIRHGLSRIRLSQPIAEHLGEVLKESVLVNTADPKRPGEDGSLVLLGAGLSGSGEDISYATFRINRYTKELESINYMYSMRTSGVNVENNKETDALNATGQAGMPSHPISASEVTIAEALEAVKKSFGSLLPDKVLERFGINREEFHDNDSKYLQHSIQDDADAAYADAVAQEDWRTAERMLLEKAESTEGITGYKAPHFYAGEHQDIAKAIKSGDQDVIRGVVRDMAPMVPENAVLVPMPPHEGKVLDDTDTMILARALSEETGAPVVAALESDYHPSRYKAKANGDRSVNAKSMGFRQVAEIPEGAMPVYIDNMVGGGQTAMAARNAIGRGITLAYAQSPRSKSLGVKAATVTFDENGNLIPLSQRMDPENKSWKYSITDDEITDEDGNVLAEVLRGGTVTAYSLATVEDTVNDDLVKELVQRGFKKKDVDKWVKDVYGIAAMIAADRGRLDFEATRGSTMLKNNQEYIKTLDASTLCAKRLLYQGIFNEIQHLLPNTPILPEDLIKLVNMMKRRGLQTPCGICYVESRRRMLGKYADQWLKEYDGEYIPKLEEVTTTDGLEALRNAPEGSAKHQAYLDFVDAMNAKGSANPKVVQLRTDYKGEIRKMTDSQIRKVKEIGGLRVQSFSDFEVVHLLDMMQAVMDMAAKDLTSQAYTKVPAFAWVFGDTGIKINLSLIGEGNGLDENGNLIFSSTEGMDFDEAMKIRNQYSKNVGTILVGMNDAHVIAAMGDDRIDFIIPFHKSGWGKREMAMVDGMSVYKDFTRWQNEKKIDYIKSGGGYKTIPNKKSKLRNFEPVGPNGYWDFNKTGTENAETYLRMCAEDGRIPKFHSFLVDNGDGSFSLPTDDSQRSRNIRKGYWKLLIDFKMYDNEGVGAPQQTVQPNFNMEAARDVLNNYEGGADTLPTNHEIARQFAEEYKAAHPKRKQFSIQDETDVDVRAWMQSVNVNSLKTEAERELLRNYQGLEMRVQLKQMQIEKWKTEIARLEQNEAQLTKDEKKQLQNLKIRVENATTVKEQAQEQLGQIVGSEGYGRMMKQQSRVFNDFMYGRTSAEVSDAVIRLQKSAETIAKEIAENRKIVEELEKTDTIKAVKEILESTTADAAAGALKRKYNSTWTKNEIRNYLDPILLKMSQGEDIADDVQTLAEILVTSNKKEAYEGLEELRGLTITIGKDARKEIKGTDSSLKEIRSKLEGTGIKVRYGETSSLDKDLSSLREEYPGMPEFDNNLNAINEFVDWVNGMRGDIQFYDEKLAEAMADIMSQSAAAMKDGRLYVPSDAKARKQIMDLVEFVKGLNARTEAAEKTLAKIGDEIGNLTKAGSQAAGMADVLTTHIGEALEYYDRTAKLAVAQAKQNRQDALIEQLKSKHAQEIMKRNDEWRALIERDKQAAKVAEDNMRHRNQINTDLKRLYKLLKEPKGSRNIPEYMQGLARELLETFVDNDIAGGRKLTRADTQQLAEAKRLLTAWEKQDGPFNMADIDAAEEAVAMTINQDLMAIYEGIAEYNRDIRGKNKLDTLQQRNTILKNMQEAVSEIYSAIRAEGEIQLQERCVLVEDQAWKVAQNTNGKSAKEWTGKLGGAIRTMHKAIVSGNMTPEYFFRTIGNAGLTDLWEQYHYAENRNGLELAKAKARLSEIAEEHGYSGWDTKQKITLELEDGKVDVTLGQLMSLWATWKRENTLGPAMSQHLTVGGFYAEQDLREGIIGKQEVQKRAHKVTEADMERIGELLTEEQKDFVDDVVGFMSSDMSELGNEASMAAYGIKMYKESYYFPFKMWDGIKNRKSNDAGGAAAAQDRAFHPSFSKSRLHGANNTLMIGDFMQTAADHISGMINYATMGLANENLQKVLNQKIGDSNGTQRNVQTILESAYGQEAMQYLNELKTQLNGGAVRTTKSLGDKAISLFRKNAVAGSLSVAAQQPLSYIRAATMINPKYLTKAVLTEYWKGSYQELMQHSGVAVIKDMGRFDMNAGQSAREYLMPDEMENGIRKAWGKVTEAATILPEKMDAWTWTRMWVAVKAEQHAQHPEMDMKSDKFLDMCGTRFNEVMRRTQVYDSTLVKSSNMRSDNYWVKSLTSFMAEPTVTLNVLADAVRSAASGERGGKGLLAKAAGTFLLSGIFQAAIKAVFSSGRSPDDKKTWAENFLNRFGSNMISEADPVQLIPGYSDLISLLKDGELQDDAMGAIGKLYTSGKGIISTVLGQGEKGLYRDLEDSVGQLTQLMSGLPLKNIMREMRAIYNWTLNDSAYADRPTDPAVLRNQAIEGFWNADNLIGVINKELGEAGYKTDNKTYYKRIYEAKKAGDEAKAQDLINYLLTGKGVKQETITKGLNSLAKEDTEASAADTAAFLISNGSGSADDYIRTQLKSGELTAEDARKLLKQAQPDKDANSIWWSVDRIQYQLETGAEKAPGGNSYYYRLTDAVDANKDDKIRKAVKELLDHGITKEKIKGKMSDWKQAYLKANSREKIKIRDAIHKVFKTLGYTAADADKVINKWK